MWHSISTSRVSRAGITPCSSYYFIAFIEFTLPIHSFSNFDVSLFIFRIVFITFYFSSLYKENRIDSLTQIFISHRLNTWNLYSQRTELIWRDFWERSLETRKPLFVLAEITPLWISFSTITYKHTSMHNFVIVSSPRNICNWIRY